MAKIEVSRTAPFELLNHSDLADMPDTTGTNSDHDVRYDARYGVILPIGTVLMYNGTGIANVGTRTEDIGDDVADTITLSGWKVCNGNALTPNLLNRFIRSEIASGATGGSDDAINVSHTHTNSVSTEDADHKHGEYAGSGPTAGWSIAMTLQNAYQTYGTNNLTSVQNAHHKHSVIINNAGVAGANANIPAYYSLIFIIRIS